MRIENWHEALADVLANHGARPFEWGQSDCFNLSMDAVQAITGTDPYAKQRRVKSEAGAAKALRKSGFSTVGEALVAAFPETHRAFARAGDLAVMLTDDGQESCGVVTGSHVACRGRDGLLFLPISDAKAFYAVD